VTSDLAGSYLSLCRPAPVAGYSRCAVQEVLNVDIARNNSCIVAIVGYHEISVYRAVAWIPVWVTVTSVAIR
jgi:hypothetical protein